LGVVALIELPYNLPMSLPSTIKPNVGVDIQQLWMLVMRMTWRDISSRYKGSILGVFWTLIVPLITVVLYTFLFSYIFKARWAEQEEGVSNYALILFAGLILHGFLSEVFSRACSAIRSQSNLVKKVVFPLHALPAVVVFSVAFQMLVSLGVLIFLQLLMVGHLTLAARTLPLLLIPLIFIGLGSAWLFGALGVFLQDLVQIVGLMSTVLMFSAPILYPMQALPDFVQPWLFLNPLTFLVGEVRSVLLFGRMPDWSGLSIYFLFSVFILLFGWWVFDRTKKGFADVL
jgi:lipopolysaccharide transport system permease protein